MLIGLIVWCRSLKTISKVCSLRTRQQYAGHFSKGNNQNMLNKSSHEGTANKPQWDARSAVGGTKQSWKNGKQLQLPGNSARLWNNRTAEKNSLIRQLTYPSMPCLASTKSTERVCSPQHFPLKCSSLSSYPKTEELVNTHQSMDELTAHGISIQWNVIWS